MMGVLPDCAVVGVEGFASVEPDFEFVVVIETGILLLVAVGVVVVDFVFELAFELAFPLLFEDVEFPSPDCAAADEVVVVCVDVPF